MIKNNLINDKILFNNNFIFNKKKHNFIYKKKFYNSKCGDELIIYFIDNKKQKFYYTINGCFISKYSTFLLFQNLKNKSKWIKIYNLNNKIKKHINIVIIINILKKELKLDYKIIQIFNNNPYRLWCFLFVWIELYEYIIKKK